MLKYLLLAVTVLVSPWCIAEDAAPLIQRIKVQTLLEHDDGESLWFHPRATMAPDGSFALLTLQKHLQKSDFYSGLSVMYSTDRGVTWSGPDTQPELAWVDEGEGVVQAVCDVTPGPHRKSGKIIAIGAKVRYKDGEQISDTPHSHEAAYAVCDPATRTWTPWRMIEVPETESKFYGVTSGCVQWIEQRDGSLLIPMYFNAKEGSYKGTVLHCAFDGDRISYLSHGDEFSVDVERGIVEPSLTQFQGRYYLTLRNDQRGYVTVGDDGLHFAPMKPWVFDDGEDLGSYNTQQHWLTHSEELFLVYTRRGANNDHIFRHRAPLFIAQVEPERLCVIRDTEQVVIPERGATLGNFGANAVSSDESWVTVAEGIWNEEARQRGATGAVFLARIRWARPNTLVVVP